MPAFNSLLEKIADLEMRVVNWHRLERGSAEVIAEILEELHDTREAFVKPLLKAYLLGKIDDYKAEQRKVEADSYLSSDYRNRTSRSLEDQIARLTRMHAAIEGAGK